MLGIDSAPWSVEDVLRLGRIAAMDFTWKIWLRLLKLRRRSDWERLWRRLVGPEELPVPHFAGSGADDALEFLLGAFIRNGSNSVAVAGARSASGAPLIASDPHLQILLPNLWLIAGYRSPSYHAVGFMIPGVPAIALGRNPWIAWGGTSLRAASSDLFDVSGLEPAEITERRERIKVRWAKPREITIRDTRFGPIVSDARRLDGGHEAPLALRWVGHEATDEISALLAVNRARSWREFLVALEDFAVPAQNMIFADVNGHVGQAMAAGCPDARIRRVPT